MTDDEAQRKMDFILEQQAQFAANQQKAGERFVQIDKHIAQITDVVGRLATATLNRFDELEHKIAALVDSQLKTEESIQNLTAVVDRYFSEGRNGKS
ncbi:MAG: hypothetical protein H0W76_28140 [Pyrinomonadaceae bacterium]|nr:hypothetical protein [Pyrinomonadaceae bacterium]